MDAKNIDAKNIDAKNIDAKYIDANNIDAKSRKRRQFAISLCQCPLYLLGGMDFNLPARQVLIWTSFA